MFFRSREHVFDRIAKLGIPQVDTTLVMLEVGFGSKKTMKANLAAPSVFVILFAALNAFLKTRLHCKGHRQTGLVEFKHAVELWINQVMYQQVSPTLIDSAIASFEKQEWHDVDPACFLDHLYEVLIGDNVLARLVTTNKHEATVKAGLQKVTTNLFAEHNIPLTIIAAATEVQKAPRAAKSSASKSSKETSKSPKAPASKTFSKSSKSTKAASKTPKSSKTTTTFASRTSKTSNTSKTSKTSKTSPTVEQLKVRAAECNISGRSKMRKAELIAAIKKSCK